MSDLRVRLAGVDLPSPLVLASGVMGVDIDSLGAVAVHGVGAVTTKSFSIDPRPGHPNPCVLPFEHGMLNAVGLANPGAQIMCDTMRAFRHRYSTPVIASVFAKTVDGFAEIVARAAEAIPEMIEVNVSCPNVASEFGTPFGSCVEDLARITRLCKDHSAGIPVAVKLSLNGPAIGRLARICEDNGADVITAINTVGPGMIIDPDVGLPVLSNKVGGLSGPAILPLAVRAVWDIVRSVRIPVIGTGGVIDARAAVQMILAGATAVGVGTAVYYGDLAVFAEIHRGLRAFMDEHGFSSLEDFRGAAHRGGIGGNRA